MFARAVLVAALAGLLGSCARSNPELTKKVDDLSKRVETLEASNKKMQEVVAFVAPIMEQQKLAEAEEAASEPDPDARFAVDVAGNAYDGPEGAAVTIIEAFDFA
jgi:hypothetical protein